MSQALFAEEYSSLVSAVRARRASLDWRRLCFTNGALAFPSLYLALRSTHRARLDLVRRSRLLRLANSAFWCRSPSSFSVCPLFWCHLRPSVLASHLSSATSTQLLYSHISIGGQICRSPPRTILLRSSSSISVHFSPRSFSSPSRSSSVVGRLRPSRGVLEPCGLCPTAVFSACRTASHSTASCVTCNSWNGSDP